MLEIKGFIGVSGYSDNTPDKTATVGELSKISRSFCRDIKEHVDKARPEIVFNLFSSKSETELDYAEPTADQTSFILEVATWVVDQGRLQIAVNDLVLYIQAINGRFVDFPGTWNVGALVEYDDGYYPSYVRYVTPEWSFQIWFSDTEFQLQYDEYSIDVVFPVEDIDTLVQPYDTVHPLLAKATSTYMLDKVMQVEKTTPSTMNKGRDYTWYDFSDQTKTQPCNFVAVIFGKAGDNVDAIRSAIVDAILKVSVYDRSRWAEVLPELFSPDELMMIPNWNAIMESYDPLSDDIYTSVITTQQAEHIAISLTPTYLVDHIQQTMNIVPTLWRGITMMVTPNEPFGDKEPKTFQELFPDYMLVPTTEPDFHRMSEDTRRMSLLIYSLLTYAAEYSDYYVLPRDFSVTRRGSQEFITTSANGYLYHVLTKRSFALPE